MGGSAWLAWAVPAVLGLGLSELKAIAGSHPRAGRRLERLRTRPRSLASAGWIAGAVLQLLAAASLCRIAVPWFPCGGAGCAGIVLSVWLGSWAWRASGSPAGGGVALRRIRHSAGPLLVVSSVVSPLGCLVDRGVDAILRALGVSGPRTVTEGEFLTGVELGSELGVLRPEESRMVEGILSLEDKQASEVMTPRVDLVGVAADGPLDQWREVARSVRFRYLPVYRGSMDTIEGMLDVVRFLLDPNPSRSAVEPPLLVSETTPLHELLVVLQRRNTRCAVVLDEYGGTAGLVTRSDILEEITADVEGEYVPETPPIQSMEDGTWVVDGKTSLVDLNAATGLALVSGHSDRIAGWVLEVCGRLPRPGERLVAQGCRVTVRRLRKHRILELHVAREAPPEEDPPSPGGMA